MQYKVTINAVTNAGVLYFGCAVQETLCRKKKVF